MTPTYWTKDKKEGLHIPAARKALNRILQKSLGIERDEKDCSSASLKYRNFARLSAGSMTKALPLMKTMLSRNPFSLRKRF